MAVNSSASLQLPEERHGSHRPLEGDSERVGRREVDEIEPDPRAVHGACQLEPTDRRDMPVSPKNEVQTRLEMRATSGGDIGKHTPGAPDRSFWEASCFLLHQRIIFSSSSFVIGTPSTPVRLLPFTKPAFSSSEPGATPWMTSPRRGSTCRLKKKRC